ncbi:uncharacterized protein DC041_0000685 [Schistosoma bovis]|uniref:Uncharacterized protein n=1 Tax=Schistosoma bovis TaxID=6184 RepID=A0A430QIW9_SCHBO|nr:uncharacterized protein DC041_0000685 [Schistosoma bovis]
MLMFGILCHLCLTGTVLTTCHRFYAIETDLSEVEVNDLVGGFGGTVTGSLPHQNVYEISYSECSEYERPSFGFLKRSRRSNHETFQESIKSHPKVRGLRLILYGEK